MMKTENREVLQERYELATERLKGIAQESVGHPALDDYFAKMSAFGETLAGYYAFVSQGGMDTASLEQLQDWNQRLYGDILPENYEQSWGNPAYAVSKVDEQWGRLLSYVYNVLRGSIVPTAEGDLQELVICLELLVEIYGAFAGAWQEEKQLPPYETVRQIIYWHNSDYSDFRAERSVRFLVCTDDNPPVDIIMEADLTDVRYLYRYGPVSYTHLRAHET